MSHLLQRGQCPACESAPGREILALPYDTAPLREFLAEYYPAMDPGLLNGEVYRLRCCDDCGLIFQQGVPDGTLARDLYEKWIDRKKSKSKKHSGGDWSRRRRLSAEISLMLDLLGSPSVSPRVLDFGLGWGDWCKMAGAYGCETFGVELSRDKVEHARSVGIKVVALEDLPQEHFDCINLEQVLEHLSEPGAMVHRLVRSLKPGGLMYIAVPNGNGMLQRVPTLAWSTQDRAATMAIHPLEHLNCFSHAALVKLGNRAGLHEFAPSLATVYRHQLTLEDVHSFARTLFGPIVRGLVQRVPKVIFRRLVA